MFGDFIMRVSEVAVWDYSNVVYISDFESFLVLISGGLFDLPAGVPVLY